MTRERLPNRRGHELLDFEHVGIRYTAGVSRFSDGRLAEINTGPIEPPSHTCLPRVLRRLS
jgi:hypothetical protein